MLLVYFTGYRYDLRLKSRGSYLLVGIWCLMAVVLANAYGGVLFSFLSVSKLEPALNSMEEVAQSKDVQILTQDRTELAIRLLVLLNDGDHHSRNSAIFILFSNIGRDQWVRESDWRFFKIQSRKSGFKIKTS